MGQLIYHGAPLVISCSALLSLRKGRHLIALIRNARAHRAKEQVPELMHASFPTRNRTAEGACSSSPRQKKKPGIWWPCPSGPSREPPVDSDKSIVAGVIICFAVGLAILGEAVGHIEWCRSKWEDQLGYAAGCAYPRYFFDEKCGLPSVTSLECKGGDRADLPERSYADLSALQCVDLSGNARVTRIPHLWHELQTLSQLNLSSTNMGSLPGWLCLKRPTKLAFVDVDGTPAATIAMWSSMKRPLQSLEVLTGTSDILDVCFKAVGNTLEYLDVSDNNITQFTKSGALQGFPRLKWLDLRRNQLSRLDTDLISEWTQKRCTRRTPQIGECPIFLEGNTQLLQVVFPRLLFRNPEDALIADAWMHYLPTTLTSLEMRGSAGIHYALERISQTLGRRLKNLKVLDFGNCALATFPPDLGQLVELTSLCVIILLINGVVIAGESRCRRYTGNYTLISVGISLGKIICPTCRHARLHCILATCFTF